MKKFLMAIIAAFVILAFVGCDSTSGGNGETERHTEKITEKQTEKVTEKQTEKQTEKEAYNGNENLTSISEIIGICNSLDNMGASTSQKYLVEGYVTEIVNTMYGNFYIQDKEGERLFIYGLFDSTGNIRFD